MVRRASRIAALATARGKKNTRGSPLDLARRQKRLDSLRLRVLFFLFLDDGRAPTWTVHTRKVADTIETIFPLPYVVVVVEEETVMNLVEDVRVRGDRGR